MKLTLPPHENDHAIGPVHASLTLIEYGDFQCSHSKKVNFWIQEILRQDKDLRFIYRHFPLVDLHTYAVYAALATESAGLQGRFWELQQSLFKTEIPINPEIILSLASKINLDIDKLVSGLDKKTLLEKIHLDLSSGLESGVQSTPGLFLNGFRIEGPLGLDLLKENLDSMRSGRILPA